MCNRDIPAFFSQWFHAKAQGSQMLRAFIAVAGLV
jgi:hypothetical protein